MKQCTRFLTILLMVGSLATVNGMRNPFACLRYSHTKNVVELGETTSTVNEPVEKMYSGKLPLLSGKSRTSDKLRMARPIRLLSDESDESHEEVCIIIQKKDLVLSASAQREKSALSASTQRKGSAISIVEKKALKLLKHSLQQNGTGSGIIVYDPDLGESYKMTERDFYALFNVVTICIVCQKKCSDNIIELSCGHKGCAECITDWFRDCAPACPACMKCVDIACLCGHSARYYNTIDNMEALNDFFADITIKSGVFASESAGN